MPLPDVSRKSSDMFPLSTTWRQRPVLASWFALIPAANLTRIIARSLLPLVLSGRSGRLSTSDIAYQPSARPHTSGEAPVVALAHVALVPLVSSHACSTSPLVELWRC